MTIHTSYNSYFKVAYTALTLLTKFMWEIYLDLLRGRYSEPKSAANDSQKTILN